MENWGTPAAVVAFIAMLGLAGRALIWVGEVNADRKGFNKILGEVRKDLGGYGKTLNAFFVGCRPRSFLVPARYSYRILENLFPRNWMHLHGPIEPLAQWSMLTPH